MATTMHTKKEHKEKTLLAANQMKKRTLNVAKGLSRVQADRVAAAAVRNVNAYGQKEEGPSRWQERKEAKRQMYLMSTEKAVTLGVRKDNKTMREGLKISVRCQQIQCQRCFEAGHWTFECKNERAYVSRPSQTQQLQNPSLRQPLLELCDPLPPTKAEVELEEKPNSMSNIFAILQESKGSKSNQSPPRKSDLKNKKRRRSKSSSSETPSSSSETPSSPSKSDSESEVSSTSSEDLTSTTYSSSTMSSPSRTTSSSRKSSSYSSTDPPTPESESEDGHLEGTIRRPSNTLAKEEAIDMDNTQREHRSQPLTSLTTCENLSSESHGKSP